MRHPHDHWISAPLAMTHIGLLRWAILIVILLTVLVLWRLLRRSY